MSKGVIKRFFSPWLHPEFLWKLSPTGKQMTKDIAILHQLARQAIQLKKISNSQRTNEDGKLNQISKIRMQIPHDILENGLNVIFAFR
jgi:hypothetical protein